MNKKLLWLFTLLFFVAGTFAEAQQPKKILRLGFLSATSFCRNPRLMHSGKVYAILAILRGKTLPLITDRLKGSWTGFRACHRAGRS